jgi:hypothetical protein
VGHRLVDYHFLRWNDQCENGCGSASSLHHQCRQDIGLSIGMDVDSIRTESLAGCPRIPVHCVHWDFAWVVAIALLTSNIHRCLFVAACWSGPQTFAERFVPECS